MYNKNIRQTSGILPAQSSWHLQSGRSGPFPSQSAHIPLPWRFRKQVIVYSFFSPYLYGNPPGGRIPIWSILNFLFGINLCTNCLHTIYNSNNETTAPAGSIRTAVVHCHRAFIMINCIHSIADCISVCASRTLHRFADKIYQDKNIIY